MPSLFEQIQLRQHQRQVDPSFFSQRFYSSIHAIQTIQLCTTVEGHDGCVNAINFNEQGDLLITGSDDSTVKIWSLVDSISKPKCIQTLRGHSTNVFAVNFLPHQSNKKAISGGNDGDVRYFDIEKQVATVFGHHHRKVLKMSVNPVMPDTFLTASADGTCRLFDIRGSYSKSRTEKFSDFSQSRADAVDVFPQALGGGKANIAPIDNSTTDAHSLLVNFDKDRVIQRRRRALFGEDPEQSHTTLYSVDVHPLNGHLFIVSSSDGNVRLFDLRRIDKQSPESYVNIFRNVDLKPGDQYEATGCSFSVNGNEIVSTQLSDHVYVFDTNKNYEKEYHVNYKEKTQPIKKRVRRHHNAEEEEEDEDDEETDEASRRRRRLLRDLNSIFEEEEEEQQEVPSTSSQSTEPPLQTYKHVYSSHISRQTIKGCGFFGSNSEYVITGSDDARIYIYDKVSTKLLRVLKDHEGCVNTVTPHPHLPMIASGGIDDFVKIWGPNGDVPSKEDLQKRQIEMDSVNERRNAPSSGSSETGFRTINLFSLMRFLMASRTREEDE